MFSRLLGIYLIDSWVFPLLPPSAVIVVSCAFKFDHITAAGDTMVKRVAIIGAGASGLPAIKTCLEYGLEPICFEKTARMGGLWRYKSEDCEGEASVMKSTVINTSKEMMAYTDFPPPKDFPNFMHNTKVLEYLQLYADHFNVHPHIRYQHQVVSVRKNGRYDVEGSWDVQYKDLSGEVKVETFDGVFLCTGHHVEPYRPDFKGLDTFKGKVIHSHSYKDHVGYEDKRVVIVGIGNSGGDIAVELSRIAAQVYLVTRRGSWVLNRVGDWGLPLDIINTSRVTDFVMQNFPNFSNWYVERMLNRRFDHEKFGLLPNHRVMQQHPMVNDDLPNRMSCGTIVIKPNVTEFTADGAKFEDGTEVNNIDEVILCTGYSFGFPYLQEGIIPVKENRVELYHYMYSPTLHHPSLTVIGLFQPLGSIMPISEMQCRVACEMLLGRSKMPSKEMMLTSIQKKKDQMAGRYVETRRHTIQVDYVAFMNELSSLIGGCPDIKSIFLSDPVLAWAVLFGPCLPYQYRLSGFQPWKGAREAILTVWDRIYYPTARKALKTPIKQQPMMTNIPLIGAILALLICLYVCFF